MARWAVAAKAAYLAAATKPDGDPWSEWIYDGLPSANGKPFAERNAGNALDLYI